MTDRVGSRTPFGAATRGAGVPILSSETKNRRAKGARSTLGKIGGTAHPRGGPVRHGTMGLIGKSALAASRQGWKREAPKLACGARFGSRQPGARHARSANRHNKRKPQCKVLWPSHSRVIALHASSCGTQVKCQRQRKKRGPKPPHLRAWAGWRDHRRSGAPSP